MDYLGDLRVVATRENLRTISYFVQGVCQRLNLRDDVQFDVELAVEEAATNIINHAYGSQRTGNIDIHAELDGDALRVTLKDWGEPLDPQSVKPFDIHAPVETRIQGGMGLHFIHTLMDGVERHNAFTTGEPNRVTLIKRIQKAERAHERKSAQYELNALQTVSEVMTANIGLDDLLKMIVQKLVDTIGAERGTLYLIDLERGECWSKVLLGEHVPEIRLKLGEGIAGYVAQTGEALHINDAYADPRFNPHYDELTGFKTRNLLAVPLRNPQQEIIGVVQLINKKVNSFTQPDARMLAAMASQAAVSIENTRLYEQVLQKRLMERELEMAHTIQERFLPEGVPIIPGWDIAAFWKPVKNVAGDFYDFLSLEDGRLAVIIADVSGKGIPAALFMALMVMVIRFVIRFNLSPLELIENINSGLVRYQRSRMFATIFVGYIDLQTGAMEYVVGGHNPPAWYRAASRQIVAVEGKGTAVGVFPNAPFEQKRLTLEADDLLILYTDGITEIINAAEEEFGEEQLAALLIAHAHRSAGELTQIITEAVHSFAGALDSFDDETLIILKRNSPL